MYTYIRFVSIIHALQLSRNSNKFVMIHDLIVPQTQRGTAEIIFFILHTSRSELEVELRVGKRK